MDVSTLETAFEETSCEFLADIMKELPEGTDTLPDGFGSEDVPC